MSLAQGNNTPARPRIEPGSPDQESDALTTRPVRPPRAVQLFCRIVRHVTNVKMADVNAEYLEITLVSDYFI